LRVIRPLAALFALVIAVAAIPLSASAQNLTGTLAKIKQSGEIVIGHRDDGAPYAFLNMDQKITGYSIDVCDQVVKAVAAAVGSKDLKVRYVSSTAATRIPLVANGTVDLDCGNATDTFARAHQVDFSLPIFFSDSKLLVLKSSPIKGYRSLGGKTIAVVQNTTSDSYFTGLLEAKKINVHLIRLTSIPEAMLAVTTGRADAFAGDVVPLGAQLLKSPDRSKLHIVGSPQGSNPICLMTRQNDSAFRLVVNGAISKMIGDGELFKLQDKWFGPLGIKLDAATRRAFIDEAIPME